MKNRILVFAAVHAYVYLAFAFICADWSPLEWDPELRGMCVFLGTAVGVIAADLTKE